MLRLIKLIKQSFIQYIKIFDKKLQQYFDRLWKNINFKNDRSGGCDENKAFNIF